MPPGPDTSGDVTTNSSGASCGISPWSQHTSHQEPEVNSARIVCRGAIRPELTSYRAIPRTGTNPVCRNALPCRTTAAACLPMHSAAFDSSRQCCGGRVMELLARVRSHAAPAVLPPIVFPSYHFLWKKKNVKFFRELRVIIRRSPRWARSTSPLCRAVF